MKANRAQIERALDAPSSDVRVFLLYGPDESQSRELAARIGRRLGPEAERIDLTGASLKSDPARLADEAASSSLFGDPRYIRVEPAGDEMFAALDAVLDMGAVAINPVVIVAGALRKDSRLLKRVLADRAALAFASYLPEGNDADRLAAAMAREHGLRLEGDIAHRLAMSTGGDRALLTREIEKLSLYADAAAERPATLELSAFDAISADSSEGDLSRLIDALLSGHGEQVTAEIARLAVEGVEGIAILRPLLRRLLLLADLRGRVDHGDSIEAVMAGAGRAVYFKDQPTISAQVARWSAGTLAKAIERIGAVERAVKAPASAGPILVEAELLVLVREGARRR
jgi:DNA polymerase-3 subunit delta